MSDFQIFEHPEFGQVRINLDEQGNPWRVAADVRRVLELSNTFEALRALKDDEKMTARNPDSHSGQRGGAQPYTLINEPGYYRLFHKSRTPVAEKFQHWNYHVVLPSNRKTGGFLTLAKRAEILAAPEAGRELAQRLEQLESQNLKLENRVTELQDDLDSLTPFAEIGFTEDRVAIEALPKILYDDESLPPVLHIDVDEVAEGLVLI